jgi:uncharacterized protein (TIGR00304 family)
MIAQVLISLGIFSVFIGSILVLIGNSISSGEGSSEQGYNTARYQTSDGSEHIHKGPEGVFTKPEVRGAGIIMLGPIPIILGTDSKSVQTLILLTIVLMLMAFFLFR